jgi:F0F1-type ATP synthase membrane subunit b/b'
MTTTEVVIAVVVGAIVLLGIVGLLLVPRIRSVRGERRRALAADKLAESRRKQAEAASLRASADEQVARARRYRADAELRTEESEREARQRRAEADRASAEARDLYERAGRIDPSYSEDERENEDARNDRREEATA